MNLTRSFKIMILFLMPLLLFGCAKQLNIQIFQNRETSSSAIVDKFVDQKLKEEGLKASPLADDSEFLRRVTLDLTGIVPSVSETKEFLSSGDWNKRKTKIDQLLESPLYIEYWAGLWSNWLIGRESRGQTNKEAFSMWISEALRLNMPYDQFVSKLLTAKGPNDIDGAANFYLRYNLSPVELTSKTARFFLGLPMQCAQCHNHKSEKWTQEDYYGLAAFFVGMRSEEANSIMMAMGRNQKAYRLVSSEDQKTITITIPDVGKTMSPRFINGEEVKFLNAKGQKEQIDLRLALANFITSPRNPYFSRAIVNRIWAQFMGKGFVEPLDGFGETNPPSYPELLNWLSKDFVEHDYDLKYLIRTILNSKTYQRSSKSNDNNKNDNKYFSKAILKPLTAEQLFNSMIEVTGIESIQKRRDRGKLEQMKRDYMRKFVFLFGNDEMEEIETFTNTIPQALMLINGALVNEGSHMLKGGILAKILKLNRTQKDRVNEIYFTVLSRRPTSKEQAIFRRHIESGSYSNNDATYEDLFWSLLNSSEFAFNH